MKKQSDLLLDDIYNSPDPGVKEYIRKALNEEFNEENPHDGYFERGIIRVAWKFKHLLSPQMQEILEAKYPRPNNV